MSEVPLYVLKLAGLYKELLSGVLGLRLDYDFIINMSVKFTTHIDRICSKLV